MRSIALAALAGVIGLVLPLTTSAANDNSLQPLDRIVAVVNDSVILESELDEQTGLVRRRMRREGADPPPADTLRRRMLDQMIVEEIQLQQARQRGIEVDDETVNEALRNIASDRGTDLAGLREQMAGQEVDFAALREQVRSQLLLSRLRQRVIASQVTVSQQEIDDFLTRSDRARERNVAYRIQHILLALDQDNTSDDLTEQVRERARRLVARLREGEDFAGVAATESDGPRALEGGDLGWRKPTDLPNLFVNALETMSPGEVSDPLLSANGFHILRLADQRGGDTQSITETRARHILLRDENSDQPRRKLAELRRRIRDGALFEDLARRHSQDEGSADRGGDLGWFGPGAMTPAFQEVVETLKPGQISEPFRTPYGWHVVEVLERRVVTDVERYRTARARQTLYRRKVEEEMDRWVRERREESYIDKRLESES